VSKALVVSMDIQSSINEFLSFVQSNPQVTPELGELIEHLDLLSVCSHVSDIEFDENEYPEPPEKNYSETRKDLERKFPKLGFYYSVDSDVSSEESAEVTIGDAIDDLADIVGDLTEVQWYFENTSRNNALWHFQLGYTSHWGLHLKELQLFLHRQW